MPTFYSNWYSGAIGTTGHFTTLQTPVVDRVPAGFGGSRLRHKFCNFIIPASTDFADDDEIRFFDVKSGDRPVALYISCDADQGATATWDIGLWAKGDNNDGGILDRDLFDAGHNQAGAINREDVFDSAVLGSFDRGKPFWELLEIGAGSDVVDPRVLYTVGQKATADLTIVSAAVSFAVELEYIAGD